MNVKYHPALLPPAIVVHGLAEAGLALAPGVPVTLLSAAGAAGFAGAGWWRALMAAAAGAWPGTDFCHILDCADAPGLALEALRGGQRMIVLAPCPAWELVARRASMLGAQVLAQRPRALDLATPDARRRLPAWLAAGSDNSGGMG